MRFDDSEKGEFEHTAVVHTESLLRVACRLLGDPSAAEDAVQETLLSGWRSFDQFQRYTNCKAWLFKIMLRIIGKGRRRQSVPTVNLEEGQDLDNVVPVCTTKSLYTKSEILTAIDSLPQEQRSVVILAAVEGFTCKEISAMLEVPMGTVMSRLSRGRAEARKWLAPSAGARRMNSEPAG